MKVFVAGATGVLGRALVPQLVARGHEAVGMTRSPSKQELVRGLEARPVIADALDPDAVAQAVSVRRAAVRAKTGAGAGACAASAWQIGERREIDLSHREALTDRPTPAIDPSRMRPHREA